MPSSHKRRPPAVSNRTGYSYHQPAAIPTRSRQRIRTKRRKPPGNSSSLFLFLAVIGVLGYLIFFRGNGATAILSSLNSSSASSPAQIVRLRQDDLQQFDDQFPSDTWWASSCSAAAMAEVMNQYGHRYHIADVLKVEDQLGGITPQLGLLEPMYIDKTVAQFGFQATWIKNATLDKVIAQANAGKAVIINIPKARGGTLYPGGHFLVVVGGSNNRVETVDSSKLNITTWTRGQPRDNTHYDLLDYYSGLAVLVQPVGAS